MSQSLSDLPSLGETSAELLRQVGIQDVVTLKAHGPVASYRALRAQFGKRITVNWVYALECAIESISWRMLTPERKAELRAAAHAVNRELQSLH